MILPGAWLGVLGGGQLGRMFAVAAQRMGYRVLVLAPEQDSVAAASADRHLCAALDDAGALDEMARVCAAVTVETENAPVAAMERLMRTLPLSPQPHCVAIAQDRIREKRFISDLGLSPAPHAVINTAADLENPDIATLLPGVLKLSRLGYDGKGQARVDTPGQAGAAFAAMGGAPCVLERRIALRLELSVVLARSADGATAVWPVAENRHSGGILDVSIVPARIAPALEDAVTDAALRIAHALDYRGVLCVEFFVGEQGEVLVNEFAPRPHNSGHFSIEACTTSQFEQQVRVLAGLPLGTTGLRSPAVMQNLLGDLWQQGMPRWDALLTEPGATLHLYGKAGARPGRKMGHYTCIAPTLEEALATSQRIRQRLAAPQASPSSHP
jgi:5-(carboxyamino)imidazole ribonucleotide synthase